MKKIALITGITGQDGFYLAKFLLDKNYIVHGVKRRSSTVNNYRIDGLYKQYYEDAKKKCFFLHYGDVTDSLNISALVSKIKPDEIYNFADQDHVNWSFELPSYSFGVTASSIINLLEIIKKYSPKSKYFQPLSSNMFGNSKNKKQNENEALTPLSIYALGKATAYHACKLYRDVFGLKTYGAIFYNHESEVRPEEYVTRKITKSVARIFYKKQRHLFLGDINAKIDWGYARDYVEAAHKLMQLKKPDFFVIGSGKANSIKYFAKKAFEYVGLDYKKYIRIDKKLLRKSKNKTLVANTKKAQKLFNFKIKTNIDSLIDIMMKNDLEIEKGND